MEPTEDEISRVLDFLGLDPVDDRALVIRALQNNSRDVQAVVSQYFDDPANFRTKYSNQWDERMFSGDRDGVDNNAGISFHVEAPAQHEIIHGVNPMDGSAPGAPSRPPSRTNSKSPLGKMVDWTAQDTNGIPNTQAQEEEDMQRAIRESAQEAGIEVPVQESGVMDASTSQPYFGPANRDSYDQNNWAMVPTGPQEARVERAPPPSARKRAPAAPAFLIQGHYNQGLNHLGGLLTILHEIPLARNIMLSLGDPAATYGHNGEWWNGQEILPEHVLAKLATGEIQWGEHNNSLPNLETEVHRIMAFLDSTERGYGSVKALTEMINAGRGAEKQFYETIAVRNDDKIQELTQVAALCEIQGDSTTEDEVANFGLLEMEHPRSEYSTIKTLYESLDHVMWNDALTWNEIHEGTKMAAFKKIGETLVLKVGGDGPEGSIDIPLELYPEKYMLDRKNEAARIQAAWVETKLQGERLRQAEQTLTIWRDEWNNKTYDKKDLVQKASLQWQTYREYLEGLGRFRSMEESGFDTDKYPVYHAAPIQANDQEVVYQKKIDDAVRVTERLMEDIDKKLQWLKSQSQQLEERQRFIGRLLTDPDKDRPRPMSCKKYLLRGVATTIDVIYVCQRSEPDLIDLEDPPKPLDQWWRLSRAPDEEQVAEKVEVERVLRDMWQETKTPLMVYATENALNTPRDPLSGPLERFVKADNKAFRQELNQEQSQSEQPLPTLDVISPTKRKHRADSMDSMNSNRASLGSIDMDDRDDPFLDQYDNAGPDLLAQEMEAQGGASYGDDVGAKDGSFALMDLQKTAQDAVMASMNSAVPMAMEEADSSTTNGTGFPTPSTSTQTGGFSRTISPDAEVSRSPEMQERGRPPPLMATKSISTLEGRRQEVNTMEMEVPEHHD